MTAGIRWARVGTMVVTAIAIAALGVFVWHVATAGTASAHGKDLAIAVTPLIPDPEQPLMRLYRVHVVYENDLEPVEDAKVVLTARQRDGASDLSALELTEVNESEGLYVGEFTFDRFGDWQMELSVRADQGQGEGDVEFSDTIRPGALNPEQEAALREEAERVINLQLSFGFGWWPDVANIVMRIVHSMAGLSYFVITGLVFGLAWFGLGADRPQFARRVSRYFLPAAAISLLVLLGAGLYSAAYDAPITYPGIYDLSTMREIPYGEEYLAAFFVKVALFFVLAVMALRIGRTLKLWNASGNPHPSRASAAALRRETLMNAAVGVAVVADVAVLIYLHYISHLGVFLPEAA